MKEFSIPISRRDFFKIAGLTTAGAILSNSVEISQVDAAEKKSLAGTIKYAGKEIPVLYNVDVCVCGGGPSGTAAAICAARNGVKQF